MKAIYDVDVGAVVRKFTQQTGEDAQRLQDAAWVAIADLVGNDVEAQVSSVLQSVADVADSKWEDEEDDSCYSDEECEDEVVLAVASKGLGECGFV